VASKAELALILSLVDDVSKTAKGVRGNLLDLGHTSGGVQGMLLGLGKVGFGAIVGGAALAGTALAGIGALAFKSAMDIDNAMDTIAIGTGATGERLAELKVVMTDVLQNTASDAATVSGVLAALDAKLEASDEDMYNLTLKTTELSRMMGTDATQAASLFARTLGDWGVSAEEGSGLLDKMFVATQQSGIGFERLNELMVQFGAPMRTFGFSIEESMALLSKWEREGVNTELVMGSLRIAAGKFAKAGKPLRESLLQTFNSISTNTDATAALAEGMQVFGARAGPDMVAAIREGRFAIDDMVAMMGDAEGAILETSRATEDWPEKLARAKNRIMVTLAPIGDAFIGLAGKVIDRVMPALGMLGPWIEENVVPAFDKIGGAVDIFFQGLDRGKGPLESFKDVLWKLLPPGMAADLTGAIGWVQTLVGEIKAGDWEGAGGMIFGQLKLGFQRGVSWGADVLELLRSRLNQALGLGTGRDMGAGSDTNTWGQIGLSIWNSITAGIASGANALGSWIEELRTWATSADTAKRMQTVGYGLADSLLTGMNTMFEDKDVAASYMGKLNATLGKMIDDLMVVGWGLGGAFVQGIQDRVAAEVITVSADIAGTPAGKVMTGVTPDWLPGLAADASNASFELLRLADRATMSNSQLAELYGISVVGNEKINILNDAVSTAASTIRTSSGQASGALDGLRLSSVELQRMLASLAATRPSTPNSESNYGPGRNAGGTDWWRGGPTWVGERGPEVVVPPRGSQILNNRESQAMGGNTYVTIQAGAIVVNAPNAEQAGKSVIDRLLALGVPLPVGA
jgi:hypothetical protein